MMTPMDHATLVYTAALIVLLIISAGCSCSETVFFSLDPLRLRRLMQQHPKAGERIHRLMSRPTRVLSTILILNTVVNITAATVAYELVSHLMSGSRLAEPVSIVLFTLTLLVFGEYGPKHLGLRFSHRFAGTLEPVVRAATWLIAPLRWGLERITHAFETVFQPAPAQLSNAEFATAVNVGGREGIIDAEEWSMIQAIIGLQKKRASDVMRPRVELIGLDLDEDAGAFPERVQKARRRYLLLYRHSLDTVEGFLDCRKFLLDPEHSVAKAHIAPYFVPENVPLSRLLTQFQKERRRIAVVVDEYGSVAGVVTRGDILEEISGEIYQELSRPRPVFMESGPGRWITDAGFTLKDLNRKLSLSLEAPGTELLAGWVAYHMGHIPAEGETLEMQGIRATVLKTDRNRVALVQIQKLEAPQP